MNTAYSAFSARSSAYGTIKAPSKQAGSEDTMKGMADPRSIKPLRKYPRRPGHNSNEREPIFDRVPVKGYETK